MKKTCGGPCGCDATSAPDTDMPASSSAASAEWLSVFAIPKMDCPSEERMIRLALNGFDDVRTLSFDLSNRRLKVVHDGAVEPITARLATLGLGATLQETVTADPGMVMDAEHSAASDAQEFGTLRVMLGINALMFIVEMTGGLIAQSTGRIADSLDMFADAAVYDLALYAVGLIVLNGARRSAHPGAQSVMPFVAAIGSGTLGRSGHRFNASDQH